MSVNKKSGLMASIVVVLTLFLGGCAAESNTGAEKEDTAKKGSVDRVIEAQPGEVMKYSPTRNTIRTWGKYWEVPGRLAYTYITDGPNDFKGGYYVFVGPPVSMCVGLTSPVQKKKTDLGDYNGEAWVPAPGIDVAYGGGDCSQFYGIDAVTKLPVAFSVGMGQNMTYFGQPNQRYESAPLGAATFDTAKKGN